jgi:hypothetical protein
MDDGGLECILFENTEASETTEWVDESQVQGALVTLIGTASPKSLAPE